jgi:hypothetical protein
VQTAVALLLSSFSSVRDCSFHLKVFDAQNKDRVNMDLIKPAVDWRKTGVADASSSAAVARA